MEAVSTGCQRHRNGDRANVEYCLKDYVGEETIATNTMKRPGLQRAGRCNLFVGAAHDDNNPAVPLLVFCLQIHTDLHAFEAPRPLLWSKRRHA
jgi:hypothetical protein